MQTHAQQFNVRVPARRRGSRILVSLFAGWSLLGVASLSACSGEPGRPDTEEPRGKVGQMSLALTGVSATDTYRLTGALFTIAGPTAASASSDDAPDATSINLTLAVGAYTASLADGWTLERKAADSTFVPVSARLTSPNPAHFAIAKDATTKVQFMFDADGVPVQLATGNVDVEIAVHTCDGSCPAPDLNRAPMGTTTVLFPRNGVLERTGETALGDLVADALRVTAGSQLALVTGGGLRTSLPSPYVPPLPSSYVPPLLPEGGAFRRSGSPPFDLFAGDAYSVLPFGNHVVTRTITGQQLADAVEHGLSQVPTAAAFFPQISGFSVSYSVSAPHLRQLSLWSGAPVAPDGHYTIALESFISEGGDGYTMFDSAPQASVGVDSAQALFAYVQLLGPLTTPASGRISLVP